MTAVEREKIQAIEMKRTGKFVLVREYMSGQRITKHGTRREAETRMEADKADSCIRQPHEYRIYQEAE